MKTKGTQMIELKKEEVYTPKLIIIWLTLAVQAGFLNSSGFLACHMFVSHMTGTGTNIGTSLGQGHWMIALEMLLAPLSFIFGAYCAGSLTIVRRLNGKKARYDIASAVIMINIALVFILGEAGFFGVFGEPLVLQRDFLLLTMLCFACGMQNSTFVTLTNGQIRTTHLTGLSTDMGTELAKTTKVKNLPELKMAKTINKMRLMTFCSYSLGAMISVIVMNKIQYHGFAVPLLTSIFVYFSIAALSKSKDHEYAMAANKSV